MERLTQRDFAAILEFLRGSHTVAGLGTFTAYVIAELPHVVPCDLCGYNELDLGKPAISWVMEPADRVFPDAIPVFQRHLGENPYIPYRMRTHHAGTVKLSDLATHRQFRRTGLYQEFYRRLGVEHSMAAALRLGRRRLVALAFYRGGRDFSERERLRLDVLRPHLIQLHRRAEAATRSRQDLALLTRGLETAGREFLTFDPDGRIGRGSARARAWLAEYLDVDTARDVLPDTLRRWVRSQREAPANREAGAPGPEPLVVTRNGKRLVARLVDGPSEGLLLFEQDARLEPQALERLGLSRREAEVLVLVAEGHTTPRIASLLGLSARTVQTHLDHVFRKLGVETRTAAAARALRVMREAPDRPA